MIALVRLDAVEWMRFVFTASVVMLLLGIPLLLAGFVRILGAFSGDGAIDLAGVPRSGVMERAARVRARIRAHIRDRGAPGEATAPAPPPIRLSVPRTSPAAFKTAA